MCIDIIGGGGYLGRNLSVFLSGLKISHRIISRNKNINKKNILSFEEWLSVPSSNICIYLADPSSLESYEVENYNCAKNNFALALNNISSLLIYISSSKIYKKNDSNIYFENSEFSEDCLYTKLKINNEKLIFNKTNTSKLKSIILRIPNLVCTIPKSQTLFYKINETNRLDKCLLTGNYNFSNEFLYGLDLFEVIIKLINYNFKSSFALNVSPCHLTKVMDLLKPKFRYKGLPINSPKLDNSLLLSYIDYNFHLPYYSIENNCIYWVKS